MMRNFVLFASIGGLLCLAGCGESHSTDEDAGPDITFDADVDTDAGSGDVDGGPAPSDTDVGSDCASGADCDSGICIGDGMGFPGGYCTSPCGRGGMCPEGSECVPVGRGMAICLDSCDPAATERSCRMGYGCADSFMLPGPVCLPGCTDASDCGGMSECDRAGGFLGAGRCFNPGASLGDSCEDMVDCPSMSFCLQESDSGWPGGSCIGFGCDPMAGSGCAGDAVCLRGGGGGGGGGVCVDGCGDDTDCRPELQCLTDDEFGRRYCGPGCTDDSQCSGGRVCNPALGTCDVPFTPGDLGQACSGSASACDGGTCLREFESGFPGSYCIYIGCDPMAPDPTAAGCPGDGVCIAVGDGTQGACLDGCTRLADCPRDGYDCAPSDRADATSPTACMPACTMDASCANMGFVCNDGTGLCRPSFDPADLGRPCTGPGGCGGGACLTEQDDGWPGGTCGFPGCRLSGTGPSEPCPMGSTCMDDGEGDPTLGVCVTSCTVGMSGGCRSAYACVDLGGMFGGACSPSCVADTDCSAGRSCNTMTGLCE